MKSEGKSYFFWFIAEDFTILVNVQICHSKGVYVFTKSHLVYIYYRNSIVYKNLHSYFFKISDFFIGYAYRNEILARCILKSFTGTLDQLHPLLACSCIDILSLNKTAISVEYVKPIISKLNQAYLFNQGQFSNSSLRHITNLLLCNIHKINVIGNCALKASSTAQSFKELIFNLLLPGSKTTDFIEFYSIFWLITNKNPILTNGLESDEWLLDVVKLFEMYKQEISVKNNDSQHIDEIRKILQMLNVRHQSIVSGHCYVPIHITNTNLIISYPNSSDLYYKSSEYVPRYQLYLDMLATQGWDVVSIPPVEWKLARNGHNSSLGGLDASKKYIKKILVNYYKQFIIK